MEVQEENQSNMKAKHHRLGMKVEDEFYAIDD